MFPGLLTWKSHPQSEFYFVRSKPRGKLSINKVNETSIAPRENVSYSKETQTLSAETSDKEGMYTYCHCNFHTCLLHLQIDLGEVHVRRLEKSRDGMLV